MQRLISEFDRPTGYRMILTLIGVNYGRVPIFKPADQAADPGCREGRLAVWVVAGGRAPAVPPRPHACFGKPAAGRTALLFHKTPAFAE